MRAYLEQTELFTREEINYFLSRGTHRILKKGEYFLESGQTAKSIIFLKSGALRSFYYSSSSEEITYRFAMPPEIITGYSSFITQTPSRENIQAIIDCEILEFSKSLIDGLILSNSSWLMFSKIMAETNYVFLEERIFILQNEDALTRYNQLLEKNPDCLQQIPLGYIASFLGISQRHLSRLRKQITI